MNGTGELDIVQTCPKGNEHGVSLKYWNYESFSWHESR